MFGIQSIPHRSNNLGYLTKARIRILPLYRCLRIPEEEGVCRNGLLRFVRIPLLFLLLRLWFPLVLGSNVSRFRRRPLDSRNHPRMRCAVVAVFAGSSVVVRLRNGARLHRGRTTPRGTPVLNLLLQLLLLLRMHILHMLLHLSLLVLLVLLLLLKQHHLLVSMLLTWRTHSCVRSLRRVTVR